jgi:adenine deaminase
LYIEGNFIDVIKGEIYPARVTFEKTITKVEPTKKAYTNFIAPGIIDSHIRLEDSFLSPKEYTKCALLSGVTTVVEDMSGFLTSAGADAIKYLLTEFSKLPINFFYVYPLNVERSILEGGPSELTQDEFSSFIKQKQCLGVTQIDNVKKLRSSDSLFSKRIGITKTEGKSIMSNVEKTHFTELSKFTELGIRADLGSNIYQDAFEKACFGLKIKIVEGTKRKTLANLVRLAKQFDTTIVTEEKSAQELSKGYFQPILKKAVSLGLEPVLAIQNVTINPARLLGIEGGALEPGMDANIVEFEDIKNFEVKRVWHDGKNVVKAGKLVGFPSEVVRVPRFTASLIELEAEDLAIESTKAKEFAKVLQLDGSVEIAEFPVVDGELQLPEFINKLVVANRYGTDVISLGFAQGFKLVKGAFATTLSGTSGNIVAIGCSDEEIVKAINLLVVAKGGHIAVDKKREQVFELPILGVVSPNAPAQVHDEFKKVNSFVKRLGCAVPDPFTVLGNLTNLNKSGYRMTDLGLINTETSEIVDILED